MLTNKHLCKDKKVKMFHQNKAGKFSGVIESSNTLTCRKLHKFIAETFAETFHFGRIRWQISYYSNILIMRRVARCVKTFNNGKRREMLKHTSLEKGLQYLKKRDEEKRLLA